MAKKIKEFITCFDANTSIKTSILFCPICGSKQEINNKEVPELKAVIAECCSSTKYTKFKENRDAK